MSYDASRPRILATNQKGWCILQHPDGRLQLDFGSVGLVLPQPHFFALERLVKSALRGYQQMSNGKLAEEGTTRSVYACQHHKILIVVFDQTMLRFCPADFYSLAQLCLEVAQTLPLQDLEETVDYLKDVIRPALSNN